MIPTKPHYYASGNNYSVISDTSHIVNNTSISLTNGEGGLETAGGVFTLFVPDSIPSLTSESQFNRERQAVSIFFKLMC